MWRAIGSSKFVKISRVHFDPAAGWNQIDRGSDGTGTKLESYRARESQCMILSANCRLS